jgi:hypothetical protein
MNSEKYINECRSYVEDDGSLSDAQVVYKAQESHFWDMVRDTIADLDTDTLLGDYDAGHLDNLCQYPDKYILSRAVDCLERSYYEDDYGTCCHKRDGSYIDIPDFSVISMDFSIHTKELEINHGRL